MLTIEQESVQMTQWQIDNEVRAVQRHQHRAERCSAQQGRGIVVTHCQGRAGQGRAQQGRPRRAGQGRAVKGRANKKEQGRKGQAGEDTGCVNVHLGQTEAEIKVPIMCNGGALGAELHQHP